MLRQLSIGFCLLAAAWAQLPPGRIENRPQGTETETAQVGGKGWNRYSFVGDLRCPPGQALVGVRLGRSGFLDSLQVGCATIRVDSRGAHWSGVAWAASAGSATPGASAIQMVCPTGNAVSGFIAAEERDFVRDIQIECAPITGAHAPAVAIGKSRRWADRSIALLAPTWAGPLRESRCGNYAATAVSVAVGRRGLLSGGSAVQAFSTFCGGSGPVANNSRDPRDFGDADPKLAYIEAFTAGYKRCVEENLQQDLMMLPVSYMAGRIQSLRKLVEYVGLSGAVNGMLQELNSPNGLSQDIRIRGDRAGYLFCQGMEFNKHARNIRAQSREPLPPNSRPEPHVRGNFGERLAVDALASNGHDIVFFKPEISGVSAPGFDTVTMKDGFIHFVDNKAYRMVDGNYDKITSVTALSGSRFDTNLRKFNDDLTKWIGDPATSSAQRAMFQQAQAAIRRGKIVKAVTNATVIIEPGRKAPAGISGTLRKQGLTFIDIPSLPAQQFCRGLPTELRGDLVAPCWPE